MPSSLFFRHFKELILSYPLLISAEQLQALRSSSQPYMIFDCTFDLSQPEHGHALYLEEHLPGAVYADLDTALSAKAQNSAKIAPGEVPLSGGRHPLPSRQTFAAWLGRIGFRNDMQAVVYDRNGANYCGRLWWMLKWAGHDAVAVLDGGLSAWKAAGGEIESGKMATPRSTEFSLGDPLRALVSGDQVAERLNGNTQILIDARAPERFRGEVEPLDAIAGHIPGAVNRPFTANFGADGRFKSDAQLRTEFEALLGEHQRTVVHHCGSGVSAIPNILAMEIAGFGPTALYAGSWSEWSSTPGRPVAIG